MKLDNRFSQHHIYGVQTDKSLNAYRLNSELTNNDINIWQLISIFKNFIYKSSYQNHYFSANSYIKLVVKKV
jgi:hypothetical protein